MNRNSYTNSFLMEKSPEYVFDAISNFRAWWSEEIDGNTDQLNETFFYHYEDVHLCKLKLITSIPGETLIYEVLDNHFSFTSDSTEWVGTELVFEISIEDGKTKVTITHQGLTPEFECYDICCESWENYFSNSLFNLIENGNGSPNRKEKDGFNADIVKKWNLAV
ncbi:SRPBCC family protein [Pararhodonellum marinum]|uniref:SRPBCC domain-containing protein n=1 Tax=Pararhodonellum marinum TaxID=2755358 RepID=UPI00188EA165|nr:SRPBCC domain-containing protein [Pararhodonellum marinum]